jgi:hypothetical protein
VAITDLINKIILEDQFSKAFDQYESRLTAVDSKTGQFKNSLGGLAVGFGVVVGGLAAGAAALDALTDSAVTNQQAMFNVAANAQALNTIMGESAGTIEGWTGFVQQASDQMRVFTDQGVANATTVMLAQNRTLRLNEEQLKQVLLRTGDLAAGQYDITQSTQDTMNAIRGEAEAVEKLGLSMGITATTRYAESLGLVYNKLSEAEQQGLRFQMFLEQTEALQGRAAKSAETLAGQEAELNRLRERAIADIGGQLLPLRQGEAEAWRLLAGSAQDSGGIISKVLAAVAASYVAFGSTAKAVLDAATEQITAYAGVVGAAFEAIRQGENPITAVGQKLAEAAQAQARGQEALLNYADTWQSSYDQILAGYTQQAQGIQDVTLGTQQAATAQSEFATAGQAAASTVAEAYEKLAADREKLAASLNQRLEAAEFDHAQRIIRIQQDIQRATAEAAADAAAARTASTQKLTEGLAEIERSLAAEKVKAEAEANAQLDRLDEERRDAKRKTAEEIKKVQADLRSALRALERDTGQEIADINSDLADDLADKQAKAAQDKLQIIQDFGEQTVRLEQQIADRRKAVNDQFESEFAEADPFRRKILEFNRKEALAQLDQQEAAEKTALETQRDQAIKAVEDRVIAEAAILEREAQQKRERTQREAAERAEELKREAEERKTALEQRLKDELEANSRRQAEIKADLAAEQAQRDQAAAEAKAKLQQKHAEELAAIDAQEAQKVARAQEALARENENHADRLAQLRFSNQQEISELQDKLAEVEREEAASYLRRLQEARSFASQRNSIISSSPGASQGFGANPSTLGFAEGGMVPGPAGRAVPAIVHGGETILPEGVSPQTTTNHITVNNYGAPGGYAGAARTARSVKDALGGF